MLRLQHMHGCCEQSFIRRSTGGLLPAIRAAASGAVTTMATSQ